MHLWLPKGAVVPTTLHEELTAVDGDVPQLAPLSAVLPCRLAVPHANSASHSCQGSCRRHLNVMPLSFQVPGSIYRGLWYCDVCGSQGGQQTGAGRAGRGGRSGGGSRGEHSSRQADANRGDRSPMFTRVAAPSQRLSARSFTAHRRAIVAMAAPKRVLVPVGNGSEEMEAVRNAERAGAEERFTSGGGSGGGGSVGGHRERPTATPLPLCCCRSSPLMCCAAPEPRCEVSSRARASAVFASGGAPPTDALIVSTCSLGLPPPPPTPSIHPPIANLTGYCGLCGA